MSEHQPTWNPDAHREAVFRRGRHLRRRRYLGAAAGTLVALTLVAVVVANVSSGSSGRRITTGGVGQPAATSTTVVGGFGVPGTLPLGPPASTLGTTATPPTTFVVRRPTTTTLRTTPATTVPSTTPTTSTTSAQPPACGSGDLVYQTATDQSRYPVGATVSITMVALNVSGHTCTGPSHSGIGASAVVRNGSGVQVYKTNAIAIACTNPCLAPVIAAGQSYAYGAGEWPAAGPAGTYQAIASRLGPPASAASFTVG